MFYKVLTIEQWESFYEDKKFHGSEHDLRDGFIHLATRDQLKGVLERYFSKQCVYILAINSESYTTDIKFENDFPHLYNSPLHFKDVINASYFHQN